jgi:hypothetical protein
MTRYREPLLAYARGSTLRQLAEPDELVHGFFASFLGRPGSLERWAESGTRLRRWMMNGLVLHARGLRRDASRNRETGGLDLVAAHAAADGRTATRMVSIRIRRTLRELLLQEGTPEDGIAAELRAIEGLLER